MSKLYLELKRIRGNTNKLIFNTKTLYLKVKIIHYSQMNVNEKNSIDRFGNDLTEL